MKVSEELFASEDLTQLSCINCGACCATYRVSFYWAEADANSIPDHYVQPLTAVHACMCGTNQTQPRCAALEGKIGDQVACSIYQHRPSPCHELQAGDEKCLRARAKHGLIKVRESTT